MLFLLLHLSFCVQKVIIFDCGSSGSRLYLYQYSDPADPSSFQTVIDSEGKPVVKKINIPLSTCYNQHDKVASIIDTLLGFADSNIPEAERPNIPLLIYATAGMRLLPKSEQEAIYADLFNYAKTNYKYKAERKNFRTIEGYEEAMFGWIGVNILTGGFNKNNKTDNTLEMGGASAQIAFQYDGNDYTKAKHTVHAGATKYNVYAFSYLGLGVDQIALRLNNILIESGYKENPCYLMDDNITVGNATLTGSGDFDECNVLLSDYIFTKNCSTTECFFWDIPRPVILDSAIGMGTAPYLANFFNYTDEVDIKEMLNKSKEFSKLTINEAKEKYPDEDYISVQMIEQVALFKFIFDGIGSNESFKLRAPFKIDGNEPQWSLGAVIDMFSDVHLDPGFPTWAIFVICIGGAIVLIVLTIVITKCARNKNNTRKEESLDSSLFS